MPEIVIHMILHVFFGPCDLSCVYQFIIMPFSGQFLPDFSLHSLSNASVSVDPGADETAIWLRATEREVLLAWGLCCCHGTDAW